MINKLYTMLLIMLHVALFTKRKLQQFNDYVITPSYKVWLDKNGNVILAKCKLTGKFTKLSLARNEINMYFN